ncbi:hypothetical protein J2S73_002229 [Amorphus orientalis]|uniref:Uncharacterized protein n=1 Tax=Amorphus orientalis TaxID=649198 RepID=A0AAE3VPL5_9HYPH|nr:hypothetical protein [Amorphus orientalis]MDQ0315772.1 hypothetical protein [Amorphus orientalis]
MADGGDIGQWREAGRGSIADRFVGNRLEVGKGVGDDPLGVYRTDPAEPECGLSHAHDEAVACDPNRFAFAKPQPAEHQTLDDGQMSEGALHPDPPLIRDGASRSQAHVGGKQSRPVSKGCSAMGFDRRCGVKRTIDGGERVLVVGKLESPDQRDPVRGQEPQSELFAYEAEDGVCARSAIFRKHRLQALRERKRAARKGAVGKTDRGQERGHAVSSDG